MHRSLAAGVSFIEIRAFGGFLGVAAEIRRIRRLIPFGRSLAVGALNGFWYLSHDRSSPGMSGLHCPT
jgi:hypothetical protein